MQARVVQGLGSVLVDVEGYTLYVYMPDRRGYVRGELGTVSAQSVYNALASFVETRLGRRIEPAGSLALYELCFGDNHHHVVCRKCGAVADADCARGRRPCLTPSETHGYLLDEAEVTYRGICPSCQSEPPSRRVQRPRPLSATAPDQRRAAAGGLPAPTRGR